MASRQTLQRPIEVEHDGKRHRGYYTVSGVRKLRIFVHFPGRARPHTDAFDYPPTTTPAALKKRAELLLWEVVTGSADMKPFRPPPFMPKDVVMEIRRRSNAAEPSTPRRLAKKELAKVRALLKDLKAR